MQLRRIRCLVSMLQAGPIQDLELSTAAGHIRISRRPVRTLPPAQSAGDRAAAPVCARAAQCAHALPAPAAPAAGVPLTAPAPAPRAAPAPREPRLLYAPMVGVGLRARVREGAPLVQVGDVVKAGQPVCVIRALSLDTEIRAPAAGVVTEVLLEDGAPVQYGQALLAYTPLEPLA